MKNIMRLLISLFLVLNVFLSQNLFGAESDPEWLKKLDYNQIEIFKKCPSIQKDNYNNTEMSKSKNFDYYAKDSKTLGWKAKVEGAHFTAGVRQGKYGNAGSLEGDLDYVLRHFPNHPQALYVMGNLQAKDHFNPRRRSDRKDYFFWSIDCYLKRAIELNNSYASTYLVAAILMHKRKDYKNAEINYKKAIALDSENVESYYNLGLLYFDMKLYEKAKENAVKAYEGNYPLLGLKQKLKNSNHW